MEIVVTASAEEAARLLADAVEALVDRRPDAVLGLATGSSPLLTYRELVERHRRGSGPSYARVRAFLLDEYVGLPPTHPQSYRATIERELTSHLDIDPRNVHAPDGMAEDLADAGRHYDAAIAAAGGVDLQVLGIGSDGHLAFNEPGSSLASRTRLKTLTARTRQDNARFFARPEDVPRHVLTQGLGTILEARHLALVAGGHGKSAAVGDAVEGPVTASCPASVLQLHPHVTVLVDEEAGSRLQRRDYYRETYENKPPWQGL
jgi:glucosamine-6-phosphate deaminase